tara:strand:- start:4913 stop:5170 length:258 start_codon:yes stop_codon:yes gene_type:complete
MKKIDPKRYNLSSRTNLLQGNRKELYVVIDRKSRIIMKDGYRILKIAKAILETEGSSSVRLLTSAPVCSKTQLFLLENEIQIKAL